VQCPFADHIHLSLQEGLQDLALGHMIPQAALWFHLYKDVEVAFRPSFSSGHGAEDTKVTGTMLGGYDQNLLALGFQQFLNFLHRAIVDKSFHSVLE
jgi:hypothetical protein